MAGRVGEESCRQVLGKSVGGECCREGLEKRGMCCREVLEKSVVEKCWRRVLATLV